MKQILTFSSFLLLLIHSSCISTHTGNIQSPSFSVKNNFKIISTIEGKSTATYILGIGGNLRNGLVNEAKRNMYSNYTLKENQNLTNITTDIKVTFFIFPILFMRKNVIVSADVIQFYDHIDEVKGILKINNDVPVKDDILKHETGSNNINILPSKSKDEILIDSIKIRDNNTFMKYNNIGEVKIGDIASYKGYNNEIIYGIVFEIGVNNKIKMRTFPSPNQELIIEDKFTWFKKIVN